MRSLVDAAALINRGRRGDGSLQRINRYVLKWFPAMPFVGGAAEFVEQVGAGAEPVVNGSLRQLLETAIWHAALPAAATDNTEVSMAQRRNGVKCRVERANDEVELVGQLFSAFNPGNPKLSRNIFVPDASAGSNEREEVELRAADVRHEAPFACVSKQVLTKIPKFLAPEIAFDANLRFLLYVATDAKKRPVEKTVTLNEILWERTDDEGGRSVHTLERVVLSGARAADLLSRVTDTPADGKPDVALLPAVRMTTGRAFMVGDEVWRIIDQMAQRLPAALDSEAKMRALAPPAEGSNCLRLAELLAYQTQAGFTMQMLEDPGDDRYCFSVARGVPPDASPKTDQFVIAVYGKPSARALDSTGAPAPIASLPRFGRARLAMR